MKALILDSTGEVLALNKDDFGYAQTDIDSDAKKVVPADNWDKSDIKFWIANASRTAIKKKMAAQIQAIKDANDLAKSRPSTAETELKERYSALIKKGQNISTIKTYVKQNFPSLTTPECDILSKMFHITALNVRHNFSGKDDFFNAGE